eukprot:maker-scaffold1046_size67555-snap-gene-0.1 protein:Tk01526 transcript:maker-scaffold1046_size67555-snap-gene-0.1-mRNA-1 annotation:"peptidase m19"
MIEGGLDVAWLIVYTGQDSLTVEGFESAYANAISKFDAIHRLVNEYAPNQIELAKTSDDVRRIQKAGKKVAMIGIENGYPIGLDITNVRKFYDKGARYMSLSHNGHSQLCDSNTGETDNIWLHNGLSDFGKDVITEMNKVGMLIDVSHPSKEAMRQMIALTKAPLIASHSSARALCNHSRNLDDEQLQWIKENVKKMGLEHVGISSDFDGGGGIEGWSDASETFNVTLELVRRGYTEPQIEQL